MRALETALLLAGGLPAALAIGPLRPRVATRGGARRAGRVAAVVDAVGFVAAAGVTRWALPPVALPTPTGAFAVGTSTVQWTDPGRPEPATPDPADRRTVVAQLWYPARPLPADLPRARYLGRDAAEAEAVGRELAAQFGLPEIVFAEAELARTAAVTDAPAERAHGPYPVVLFSPGLAGVRSQNTAWAQELASHGYVVVALDHPYDSAAVVLADGRVVRSAVTASGDDAEDNRRAAAWTDVRAADLRSALDRLAVLDRAPGPLAGLVDLRFVAVAGQSLGGAAAAEAAQQDHRFAAVVDLDGFPRARGSRSRASSSTRCGPVGRRASGRSAG